jgi:hypothetical protein
MQDRLVLGVYRHEDFTTTENSPEEVALLKDLSDILEAGGSTISVAPEIQRHKFSKNLWNISFSSIATLTQCVFSFKISHSTQSGHIEQAYRSLSLPSPSIRSIAVICPLCVRYYGGSDYQVYHPQHRSPLGRGCCCWYVVSASPDIAPLK